jgi:hypothetical protein
MSSPPPPDPPPPPAQPPAPPEFDIPNAEKYMLEADVMRRRQLRSALLHGSHRTWREHRKVWPGVVAGLVAAGLFIAVTAVKSAYDKDKENTENDELVAYCEVSLDLEDVLLEPDLNTLQDEEEISEAADSARELESSVPGHLEDQIGDDAATISDTFQAMADGEGEPEDLLAQRDVVKAQSDLLKFNEDDCDS